MVTFQPILSNAELPGVGYQQEGKDREPMGAAGAATGKQPTPLRRDRWSVHPLRPAQTPSLAVAASIAKSVKRKMP